MKKKTVVYMFVDALGWELVNEYNFLGTALPCRKKVKMQMGYSAAAIPTILSGEQPQTHDHFSFFYYDKENSPFKYFRFIKYFFGAGLHPKCLTNRWPVRRRLSNVFAKMKGFSGYFKLYHMPYDRLPYFDYSEKKDIFAPYGLAPVKNLRDILDESGLKFHISNWRKSDDENVDIAIKEISKGDLDFAFVYTAAIDGFLHDNVFDKNAIAKKFKDYENKVLKVIDALKKCGRDFQFTLISDHGMTPLKKTVDLKKIVKDTKLKFGKDFISIFDSTMLRLWYLNDTAEKKLKDRLSQSDCCGKFLSTDEMKEYGVYFPNNKYGKDIFLMDAGIQIQPCDMGIKAMNGMHGFSPEDKDSYAAIMSMTPPRFEPQHVKDFFKLMSADIAELKNA